MKPFTLLLCVVLPLIIIGIITPVIIFMDDISNNPFDYIIILSSWLLYLTLVVFLKKPQQPEIILSEMREFEAVEDRVAGQARQLNDFRVTLDKALEKNQLKINEKLKEYRLHLDTFATSMHQLNDMFNKLEQRIDQQNLDAEHIVKKGEQIIENQSELCDLASQSLKETLGVPSDNSSGE